MFHLNENFVHNHHELMIIMYFICYINYMLLNDY
jgi:hypothetical protein